MAQISGPNLEQFQWYHGRIDRARTESILQGKRPGLYLVRESTSCPGDFVLSVSESGKVSHYIINRRGGIYIIGDQTFHSIPEVIDFYTKHFLDTTTLVEIASRSPAVSPPQQPTPGSYSPLPPGGQPQPQAAYPTPPGQFPSHAQLPPFSMQQPPPQAQPVPQQLPMMQPPSQMPMQRLPMPPSQMQQPPLSNPSARPAERVRALYKFESEDPEDLPFQKGDVMVILRKDEEQWWYAQHPDGRRGQIPTPYVEPLPPEPAPPSHVVTRAPARTDSILHYPYPGQQRPQDVLQHRRSSGPAKARAIMDRVANAYDRAALSFKTNDIIVVINQNENGLWEGELNGKRGYFPFTHVELLDGDFSDGKA
ncbi:crk-like protein [Oscarella lobularis]|uniref:crk-like protein n=1 Tax=Oscarella lobularis TaxID=121494 RepID=UPI003313CAB8